MHFLCQIWNAVFNCLQKSAGSHFGTNQAISECSISLLAVTDFCCMLITFGNSLDPDKD